MAAEELRLASEANSKAHKAAEEASRVPGGNGPTIRSTASWQRQGLYSGIKASTEKSLAKTHKELAKIPGNQHDYMAANNIAYAQQSRSEAERLLHGTKHNHLCNLPLEKKGNM